MTRILCVLLLTLIAGCAGSAERRPGVDFDALPPLPQGPADEALQPSARGSSAAVDLVIQGSDFFNKNEASAADGGLLNLIAGGDPFPWAIYSVGGIGADYAPTGVAVRLVQTEAQYYVALANYSLGHWEFFPAQTGEQELAVGPFADYASPADNFYVAVLVSGTELAAVEQLTISLDDTRPLQVPTGLTAAPLNGAAQLEWEAYADDRADELRVYRSLESDMSGAELATIVPADSTAVVASDLTNGTTYYFALKAYWAAGDTESDFGNVAEVTPDQTGQLSLAGIWPRIGNREDNRGSTTATGPPSFETFVSVSLAPGGTSFPNRTTPVIDETGGVYALSADAVLFKYSADLSTKEWEFAASDHGTASGTYMCPPHSPIIDSAGNSYFIAAPDDSPGATPYLFSVRPDGSLNWRFDAVSVSADADTPYPTPNITPGGQIVAVISNRRLVVGITAGGTQDWSYELDEAREVHASPAISDRATIELPVWFSGIGIDPRQHWISIDSADGTMLADYKAFGSPANIFSGLSVPGDYHVYPEQLNLILLDATTGNFIDSISMVEPLTSSPARSQEGKLIFQAHAPYGFANRGDMRCYEIDESLPTPSIELVFIEQLNEGTLTSQPAVDVNNTIFVPDGQGWLYRIEYDSGQPISEGNPEITHSKRLSETDSYLFNSFALAEETAYIISEDNTLYCIWNALD